MSPVWRSLLYVPAHVERFVARAHTRGADAILLDLEDAVPPERKAAAREAIAQAAPLVRAGGADVLVRINAPLGLAVRDVEAAVVPGVDGMVVTKARGPEHVALLDELVGECEARAGLAVGRLRFIVLIETPGALPQAEAIARASARTVAMSLGGEDFATEIGAMATPETLAVPKQLLLHAARAAGVVPLGLVGSIADFTDIAAFQAMAEASRRMGYEGATCINPAQVPALNAAFTPGAAELDQARRVLAADAAARAEGRGAAALDGRMIDTPIVRRAERLLARAAAIAARGGSACSPD